MTTQFEAHPQFQAELAKTTNPNEAAAFAYFYEATQKEGLAVRPSCTWEQFNNGIATFNGMPLTLVDNFVRDNELIPNYDKETTRENHLHKDFVPLLDSLNGAFINMVHERRQDSAVRIICIHPTLATPFIISRALISAYEKEYGEDIRDHIYMVVGAYPTVMEYEFKKQDSSDIVVASPVLIGRSLGNLALTAPRTASTATDEKAVNDWMQMVRSQFKVNNRKIVSEPGNIIIYLPSGRRAERSTAKRPPYHHREYRPDSHLDYLTDFQIPTLVVGVDDHLLIQPSEPQSTVRITGDPFPIELKNDKDVIDAMRRSAILASNRETIYEVEGWKDQKMRQGGRVLRRSDIRSLAE